MVGGGEVADGGWAELGLEVWSLAVVWELGGDQSLNVNYLAIGILGVLGSVGVGLMSNELMDCWVVGYYYSK